MTIVALLFVCGVIYCCEMQINSFSLKSTEEMRQIEEQYSELEQHSESLLRTKATLENEAEEIFKLYDITRAITKNFDEHEMFEVFEMKLKENISFADCVLLGPDVEDSQDHFIFNLQSKEQSLGILA